MTIENRDLKLGTEKNILLINPPIYDVRYWDKWAQPYGLLRIGSLLKILGHKTYLIDCMERPRDGLLKKKIIGRKVVDELALNYYCFGKSIEDFKNEIANIPYKPDYIFVTSGMTYWWESTRDVIKVVKRIFPRATTIVGGIYPTLCPEHAEYNLGADIIFTGEVAEASDLPSDLSLYRVPPDYAIVTSSRGCPYNCAHCAQQKINGNGVRQKAAAVVVDEITNKYKNYGIKKFAFYEDNILINPEHHFEEIINRLIRKNLPLTI